MPTPHFDHFLSHKTEIMAIERNLLFANGNAYDINATMDFVSTLFERSDGDTFPRFRFESIIGVLNDFKFLNLVDRDTLIADVWDDIYITVDYFLRDYGVVDHRVEYYIENMGDNVLNAGYYVTELMRAPLGDFEVEETMQDDDELPHAMVFLSETMGATQDLDELYEYGHDQDDPIDQFESFLEE